MKLLLALLLTLPAIAIASPRDEAAAFLKKHAQVVGVETRMEAFSKLFLGLPYGDGGPLGEGPEARYDQDPLYRFDTFDCTTFVETMVSLALSQDVAKFESQMNEIRYENSEVDYLKRKHFPEMQWIPLNVQNGLLAEITRDVAPVNTLSVARAVISFGGWLRSLKISDLRLPFANEIEKIARVAELHDEASRYRDELNELDYIPLSVFLTSPQLLSAIPHGSVVNFVRPNWDLTQTAGTHMNISHQGLLFWKKGVLVLRHAGTSGDRTVAELPFIDYLKKFENHPTLKGVHFMKVVTSSR